MDWTPSTAQRDSNSRPRDPSSIAFFFEAKDLSVVYLFSYLFPYSSFRAKFHSFLIFLARHRTTFISVRCLAFGSQTLDANTSGKRPLGFVCPHATIKNCPVLLTFLLLITAINKGNVQRKWQEKKKDADIRGTAGTLKTREGKSVGLFTMKLPGYGDE